MKMKKLIVPMIVAFVMAFVVIPLAGTSTAYAEGNTPAIEKSGDLSNFAKDAPITTVRLDASKFTKDNATLTYAMNAKYKINKFEWGTISGDGTAAVVIKDLTTESTADGDDGVMVPGSFTLTYKDAAIMRDGTTRDFSVTYTPEIRMQQGTSSYTDDFTIAAIRSGKPGVTVNPESKQKFHFGLRVDVSCQVVGSGEDNLTGETFLLVSDEINTIRPGSGYFGNIVYASANNNYSEAIKFDSGIDGESDIYLPGDSVLDTKNNGDNAVISNLTGVNGYDVRFVAQGMSKEGLSHIATAASATGIRARIWSSAGTNYIPLDTYYLDLSNFTKQYTSSSGDNGKIELWTDGQTHDVDSEVNSFRKLAGGTIATPYTYAVPNGKGVAYRMTPDEGYVLDKLYVNGSETLPTNTVYKLNSSEIAYYEYSFDGDAVNGGQEISVTWKKYAAMTNPIPVRKIITGNASDKDQDFEFQMSYVSGPREKSVDNLKITVAKGSNRGEAAFGSLTFEKPGEYIYQVSEVDGKASGYSYDDKVYTVKFVIEYDQNDPDVLICTRQTILDGVNQVDTCEFVNSYEPKQEPKPASAPTDAPMSAPADTSPASAGAPTPEPKVRGLSSTGGEVGSPIALAVLLLGLGAVLGRRSKTLKH